MSRIELIREVEKDCLVRCCSALSREGSSWMVDCCCRVLVEDRLDVFMRLTCASLVGVEFDDVDANDAERVSEGVLARRRAPTLVLRSTAGGYDASVVPIAS